MRVEQIGKILVSGFLGLLSSAAFGSGFSFHLDISDDDSLDDILIVEAEADEVPRLFSRDVTPVGTPKTPVQIGQGASKKAFLFPHPDFAPLFPDNFRRVYYKPHVHDDVDYQREIDSVISLNHYGLLGMEGICPYSVNEYYELEAPYFASDFKKEIKEKIFLSGIDEKSIFFKAFEGCQSFE